MSQALYRKYRSRSLDEIVGQEHITSMLRRAIDSGQVSHAYLLTGPRGVGKTSIARIIAHEINGLAYNDESEHLDIIEIDAASNNSVDDIRDLRDKVHTAPSSANKKIYIIDEVHMLSRQAFNALLKTLEEPPAHVVFILATTDADRLPATIISRVQQFNFRTIPRAIVSQHLRHIADQESISIDDAALDIIARHGGGSFRDSISLLDQLRHSATVGANITEQHVRQALGSAAEDLVGQLIDAYRRADLPETVNLINELESSGGYATIVTRQLIDRFQSSIVEHPEDVKLLDGLLEVANSSYPYVKLLTVLAGQIVPSLGAQLTSQPQTASQASSGSSQAQRTQKRPAVTEPKQPSPRKATKKSQPSTGAKSRPADSIETINWSELLSTVDTPLKSLLAPTQHVQQSDRVIIYAGTKFKANQLTSPKQQSKLQAALQKIGAEDLTLDIRGEKAPPSDSQAAAVAAIMGGGEEVAYNG